MIVLKPPVDEAEINRVASLEGWDFYDLTEATETDPREKIYLADDDQVAIHLVHDDSLLTDYLLIRGQDEDTRPILAAVRRRLKTYTPKELLERARAAQTDDERIESLYTLAAGSVGPPNNKVIKVIEKAFGAQSEDVRHAAIFAVAALVWQELRPTIEKAAAHDDAPSVQRDATVLLEGFASLDT